MAPQAYSLTLMPPCGPSDLNPSIIYLHMVIPTPADFRIDVRRNVAGVYLQLLEAQEVINNL
ncbi:hypothetical protein BP5796_03531 [Coleophoma crateriformis]|uniref:Uncharacterized protein n=1 Tax=Coleophoma crateriformis TaxID=565419 RepID=A0A3D8SNF7_9HELO|nr:hypothetical protein BP5796_03531 [Coleophoma crateriformis]